MSDEGIRVPRGALVGAAALIGFTVIAITAGREYHVGVMQTPGVNDISGRTLVFQPNEDGSMSVTGEAGEPVAELIVMGDTFAMTAVRALVMQRPRENQTGVYRLDLRRDGTGRLDLFDPQTGRKVVLTGFGPDNKRAFSTYLDRRVAAGG